MFISAKDLIERKTEINKRVDSELVVNIAELGQWRFKVPSADEIIDADAYDKAHGQGKRGFVGDAFLVYNQCIEPDLHDKELQAAYSAKGYELVQALLMPGEISELAKMLMLKAGYSGNTLEIITEGADAVKNS